MRSKPHPEEINMTRIEVSQPARLVHTAFVTEAGKVARSVSASFVTPDVVERTLQSITRLQDQLPALRRELKMMQANMRRVA